MLKGCVPRVLASRTAFFSVTYAAAAFITAFSIFQAVAPQVSRAADCVGYYAQKKLSQSRENAPEAPSSPLLQRIWNNYGFYSAVVSPVGLYALRESIFDIFSPEEYSFSLGNGGHRADMHAHLPRNLNRETLEFIVNTALNRGVELLAVTSYGIGGADATTYEEFIDAVEVSGIYGLERRGFLSVLHAGNKQLVLLRAQEVSTKEGWHVILYGRSKRFMHKASIMDVLREADSIDIRIAAHPYAVDSHDLPLPSPMSVGQEAFLYRLLGNGLDGLEVENSFMPAPVNYLAARLAARHNPTVIITGGSDSHLYAGEAVLGRSIGLTGVVVHDIDYSNEETFRSSFMAAQRDGKVAPYGRFNSFMIWAPYLDIHLDACEKKIAEANAKRSP